MGLSPDEQKTLKALQRKAEEPDAPPVGRSVNVSVDLSDPKQVALAIKHGFLSAIGADDDDTGDDEPEEDDAPKRRGYFPDK
ncbi:MAG: hypothetical protein KGL39_32145 [Patescibacteria group bacterium]|nr:hypothetical protein [Patescibacteria group bacterium]